MSERVRVFLGADEVYPVWSVQTEADTHVFGGIEVCATKEERDRWTDAIAKWERIQEEISRRVREAADE